MRKLTLYDLFVLPPAVLPAVAFTFDSRSWLARAIRRRTGGPSHVMWLHRRGFCATQTWTLHEAQILEYDRQRIEVWWFPAWSEHDREKYLDAIQRGLNRGGLYDVLGIAGHALRLPWLNFPFFDYCSEQVYRVFREADGLPSWHPTPAQLRARLPQWQGDLYGVYDPLPGE